MSEPTPPRKRNGRRESIDLPPSMALLFNELQCPVCLDMLSSPVTTPCGHNFCKACLKQCWDNSEECKCPYCKEHFSQKPDLKINTVFKETVQLLEENSTALSSASSPLSEELQCAICLDVFNDPVSTPCGHNFCKTCLEKCWDIFENCNCPICKQTFSKRPDLKSNTALRTIGQIFEKITGYKRETIMTEYSPPFESKAQEETLDKPSFMGSSSSVLSENRQCLICLEVSTDPVTTPCGHNFCKTCLEECWENCQDHRCPCCKEIFGVFVQLQSHSEILMSCSHKEPKQEPHHRVLNIKKVKMIDLVEDLENSICEKHESLQELLCRDDQLSVCLFCTEEDHKTHNIVLIEKESRDMKAQLTKTQERVLQMIQDTMKKIQEIQHSVKMRKMPFPERLLHLQDVICPAVMESKNASPVLKG